MNTNDLQHTMTQSYTLTAADLDPQGELPLSLLAKLIIEESTLHANLLNAGYDSLITRGHAWVLHRLSLKIDRIPGLGDTFTMTTRVESVGAMSSERLFELRDSDGEIMILARTSWVMIDVNRRRLVPLGSLSELNAIAEPFEPNVAHGPRPRVSRHPDRTFSIYVRYSDLDINHHVTTSRYIDFVADAFSPEWHIANRITGLDISFMKETMPGSIIEVAVTRTGDGSCQIDMLTDGSAHAVATVTSSIRPHNFSAQL